ncbi:unnamed protein product, partial [Urochloa humidicola]
GFEVVGIHQHCNVVFFTHLSYRRVDIHQKHSVDFFTDLEHKLVAYDMDREEATRCHFDKKLNFFILYVCWRRWALIQHVLDCKVMMLPIGSK